MKMLYDLNKHLSTLITGTSLLLTAIIEKSFNSGSFKWLVVVSFILLCIALMSSVWGMFGFAAYSRQFYNTEKNSTNIGANAFAVALLSFCAALIIFMIFAGFNFIT